MAKPLPPLSPRPHSGPGLPPLEARKTKSEGLPRLGQSVPRSPDALAPLARVESARSRPRVEPARRGAPPRAGLAGLILVGLLGAGGVGALVTTVLQDDPAPIEVAATAPVGSIDPRSLQSAVSTASPSVVEVLSEGGQGSGVVVEPRGLIVTNQHVVGDADRVTVVTADNRRISARVETRNREQDLAILRPNGVAGQGARLSDEPDGGLRLGDQVFAIGSPFDLPGTVTAGVVSAVGRRNGNGVPMIQTDAPINPGNSGGGLFDLRGRLVGIPTAIAAPIRGNVGIGFAVPASRVRALLERVD